MQRPLSMRALMGAYGASQPHQTRAELQQRPSHRTISTSPSSPASRHQTPNVPSPETEDLLVLTLNITPGLATTMNSLRQQYFPPHVNRLAAHLTLFHALPSSQLDTSIIPLLRNLAKTTPTYHIRAGITTRMRRGVLIKAQHSDSPHRTDELHRQMQRAWGHFLSHQDKQNLRLHWTVANKVDDPTEVVRVEREVNEWLKQRWKSKDPEERKEVEGWVIGMTLWDYNDGNWVQRWVYKFQGKSRLQEMAQAEMRQEAKGGRDLSKEEGGERDAEEADTDELEDIDEHDIKRLADLEGQDEEAAIAKSAQLFVEEDRAKQREISRNQRMGLFEMPMHRLDGSEKQARAARKWQKATNKRDTLHAEQWKLQQEAGGRPVRLVETRVSKRGKKQKDETKAKVGAALAVQGESVLSEQEQKSRAQALGQRSSEDIARLMEAAKRAGFNGKEDQKGTEKEIASRPGFLPALKPAGIGEDLS